MSAVLEAKDAIRELMARYAQALDACRFADVAAMFAPNGEWTTDYGTAEGREAIESLLRSNVPVKGEGPQRKHFITNIIVTVENPAPGGSASAVSDYLIIREAGKELIPVMGGTYRDRFTHTSEGWRFARKELIHDISGDMALKNNR